MNKEILIEGIEEEINLIEGLENGTFNGWGFSSIFKGVKSVVKSVAKPFVKSIAPVMQLAKNVGDIPGLSAINPLLGTVKITSKIFDDIKKIEDKSGTKVKLSRTFGKNIFQTAYAKGVKDTIEKYENGTYTLKNNETTRNSRRGSRGKAGNRNKRSRRR